MPVIIRQKGAGPAKYQLISGFRRFTAVSELGLPTIAAIVRKDLENDEAAFRASVLENSQRKTYSDIDRALVIRAYQQSGHSGDEIASVMGLTSRQKRNILSLLQLPEVVQQAIDDPSHPFTATHGLELRKAMNKAPHIFDEDSSGELVDEVEYKELSVSAFKRHLRRSMNAVPREVTSIFNERGTDAAQRLFRLKPIKIDIDDLLPEERERLQLELEALLSALRGPTRT